jgi:hypothetical protein
MQVVGWVWLRGCWIGMQQQQEEAEGDAPGFPAYSSLNSPYWASTGYLLTGQMQPERCFLGFASTRTAKSPPSAISTSKPCMEITVWPQNMFQPQALKACMVAVSRSSPCTDCTVLYCRNPLSTAHSSWEQQRGRCALLAPAQKPARRHPTFCVHSFAIGHLHAKPFQITRHPLNTNKTTTHFWALKPGGKERERSLGLG